MPFFIEFDNTFVFGCHFLLFFRIAYPEYTLSIISRASIQDKMYLWVSYKYIRYGSMQQMSSLAALVSFSFSILYYLELNLSLLCVILPRKTAMETMIMNKFKLST